MGGLAKALLKVVSSSETLWVSEEEGGRAVEVCAPRRAEGEQHEP